MQIVRSPWGPFSQERLPLVDRISLIDALLYWAFVFPFRLMCLFCPCVSAFTGRPIIYADWSSLVSHTGVSLLLQLIVVAWLSRGRSLPVLTDAWQVLVVPTAMRATIAGLLRPRGQKFKVTAKGGDRSRRRVRWDVVLRLGIPLGLTIAGVAYVQNQFSELRLYHGAEVFLFWSYYNIAVLVVAMLAAIELPRRPDERFSTDEWAFLGIGGRLDRFRLSEISVVGATVRGNSPAALGSPVTIIVEGFGGLSAHVTRDLESEFELSFDLSAEQRDALLLRLFSGRYRTGPEQTDFSDILRAVALRVVR
jgi:cellulose synthase (UDP-forming)